VQTIGKYQVLRVLGKGGMGTVYEALDPFIRRKVALKTMAPGLAENADLRKRFLREAQAAGGLHHKNIVTIYDLGEDQGRPYIAMELVEGTDLGAVIKAKEPRPLEWRIDVIAQVCEGLAHAHRYGIVHRDVKPANIRITPEGDVKLVDFGVAHLQSSNMTRTGLVVGTVHYMAPEQIEGRKVDLRADIFAVGVIAFELITYRRPFEADNITMVMYKVAHELPDFHQLPAHEQTARLRSVLAKAMAKSPEDRYSSLDQMRDELMGVQEHLARPAPPPGADAALAVLPAVDFEPAQRTQAPRPLPVPPRGGSPASDGAATRPLAAAAPAPAAAPPPSEPPPAPRTSAREIAALHEEVLRARAEGHLPKALSLLRRLQEMNPGARSLVRLAEELQQAVREKEVEQLAATALAYAADGELALAEQIAEKIERLVPGSPRTVELKAYLAEEANRRRADEITGRAKEHLVSGQVSEALAAVEEALKLYPGHGVAREIKERAQRFLAHDRPGPARS
jgi:predicted Ser/Thr protein kinase